MTSCLRALCLFLAQQADESSARMASRAHAHPTAAYSALSLSDSDTSGGVSTDTPLCCTEYTCGVRFAASESAATTTA